MIAVVGLRRLLLVVAAVVVAVVAGWVAVVQVLGIDTADQAGSIVGAGVALAALIVSALWWCFQRYRPDGSPAEWHAKVLMSLAPLVEAQWRGEANRRGLFRPQPLQLRWSPTRQAVSTSAEAMLAPRVEGRPLRWRAGAESRRLATLFKRLPRRQLVVLGEPGAGKSTLALLLTLDLLGSRVGGSAVPVLVTATGWNRGVGMAEWLAGRIREQYQGILPPGRLATTVVDQLLALGLLVVVLDGIDDLAESERVALLAQLDGAFADRPYVLTCRTADYVAAVAALERPLPSAAVVEIEPVALRDALVYLRQGDSQHDHRWARLADRLRREPDGPWSVLVSSPLSLGLWRQVYADRRTDPGEVLDVNRFTAEAELDVLLLDELISQAYPNSAYVWSTEREGRARAWKAAQARRWLAFFAKHMEHRAGPDLLWWQLARALPRPLMGALCAIVSAAIVGPLIWWVFGGGSPTVKIVAAIATLFGPVGAIGAPPRRTRKNTGGGKARKTAAAAGLTFLVTATAYLLLMGASQAEQTLATKMYVAISLAFAVALIIGLIAWLTPSEDEARVMSPRIALRADLRASMVLSAVAAVAFATASGTALIPFGFASDPAGVIVPVLLVQVAMSLTFGVVLGLIGSAYGRFRLVCAWLAVTRRLPWRVMTFLDDACRRGLLREHGAAYQFRHSHVRTHLTDSRRRQPAV